MAAPSAGQDKEGWDAGVVAVSPAGLRTVSADVVKLADNGGDERCESEPDSATLFATVGTPTSSSHWGIAPNRWRPAPEREVAFCDRLLRILLLRIYTLRASPPSSPYSIPTALTFVAGVVRTGGQRLLHCGVN